MTPQKRRKITRIFSISSIRARLVMGFGLLTLLFFLSLGITIWAYRYMADNQRITTKLYKPTEFYAQQIIEKTQENLILFQKALFRFANTKEDEDKLITVQIKKLWKTEIIPYADSLKYLIPQYHEDELGEIYADFRSKLTKLNQNNQLALNTLIQSKEYYARSQSTNNQALDKNTTNSDLLYNAELAKILNPKWQNQQIEIQQLLTELIEKSQIAESTKNFQLQNRLNILLISGLVLLLVLLLALIGITIYLSNYIKTDVKQVRQYAKDILQGNIPEKVKYQTREFSVLNESFNNLSKNFGELRDFAKQVADNQFNSQYILFSDRGELGSALARMRESLKNLSEESEMRYWANAGIAKFSEIITRHSNDLSAMAEDVISQLVNYLEINQGGLFVVESENAQKSYLSLRASYAYNKKKYLEKRIDLGQGLIGQAWQEGELMYLKEIPEDYVEVTSGLGAATPRTLLIAPLRMGNEIFGVIELASLNELPNYKIEFIKKISENVAQAIASSRSNEQTKKLLRESQELASTLQAQDEQMRQNMEELQQTQDMMTQTQRDLFEKEANLKALINNTFHAIVAFDKSYRITVVNKVFKQLYEEMGVQLEVGRNLLEEIPSEEYRKNRWEYERVLSGEKFTLTREFEINTRKFYYELNYNPILNEKEEVIGASIFMENITLQRQAELQLKEAQANLSSLINDTEDMIFAIDKSYRLIVANEVCLEAFSKNGAELQIGVSILDYFAEQPRKNWQALYDRALDGERFVKVIDTGKYPDKVYREYWFNPIRNEKEQVTGISIFSRDITEAKNAENKIRQVLLESLEATENLKIQEAEMQQKIEEYELRIRELEERINV